MSLFQLKRAQLTSAASAQRRGFLSSISLFQVGVCSSKSLHPSFAQPPHLFCSSSLSSLCLLFYSARLHRAFCCFLFFFFRWTRNVTFVTHRYSEVKGKKKGTKTSLELCSLHLTKGSLIHAPIIFTDHRLLSQDISSLRLQKQRSKGKAYCFIHIHSHTDTDTRVLCSPRFAAA